MSIDQLYIAVVNDLRKSRNGFYPISQFNLDVYRAVKDAFNTYWEAGYSSTESLHDALSPFKVKKVFTPADTPSGQVSYPADFARLLSASVYRFDNAKGLNRKKMVRLVNEDERDSALESQVRPVTLDSPVAVGNATIMQLYPEQAMSGELVYLRLPKAPLYAYTLSGRTQVYDNVNSVQVELSDLYHNDIIDRVAAYAKRFLEENTGGAQ